MAKILVNSKIRRSGCRLAGWKNSVFCNTVLRQVFYIFNIEIQVLK